MSKNNYKHIISKACGYVTWDTDLYCVHHIDHNHSNNSIDNLVVIPKGLHTVYHINQRVCNTHIKKDPLGKSIDEQLLFNMNNLVNLLACKRCIMDFIKLRDDFIIRNKYGIDKSLLQDMFEQALYELFCSHTDCSLSYGNYYTISKLYH